MRLKTTEKEPLTEAQKFHLVRGYWYFQDRPFDDDEHRRRLWFQHRRQLLELEATPEHPGTVEDPRFPVGAKPAAAYDYDEDHQ